jgi:hypothetical protein
VRWIDGFSATLLETSVGEVPPGSLVPGELVATANYREMVVGDLDTEWADANEVVVERIVGDVRVATSRTGLGSSSPVILAQRLPVVRMGLLVLEETVSPATAAPPEAPSLWNNDDLQDAEWMWLHQVAFDVVQIVPDTGPQPGPYGSMHSWSHFHLDVRVKRKLGRRDALVMCHTWATVGPLDGSIVTVDVQPMLRVLVSTK